MKIDFHIHTRYSYDSLMKPAKILSLAKKRGLDGIVVCDHNTIKGGVETRTVNNDKDFLVIVGAEIATDAGDITGIFLTEEIKSRKFDDVVDEIRAQNGKVILNHPYKGHDLSKIDFSKIDFIEGYNSRLSDADNQKAVELAAKNKIPVIAGSDAHLYHEIANCKTTVKDIGSLVPLDTECKQSRQIFITWSQYIKAFKKKRLMVFVSATIIQIRYTVKQFIRIFHKAPAQ